jgi:hypothetical protein
VRWPRQWMGWEGHGAKIPPWKWRPPTYRNGDSLLFYPNWLFYTTYSGEVDWGILLLFYPMIPWNWQCFIVTRWTNWMGNIIIRSSFGINGII